MKKYIFVTFDIRNMGGVQCYLEGKVKYLESAGWDVELIYGALDKNRDTLFPTLKKYLNCRVVELSLAPYDMPIMVCNHAINKCLDIIGDTSNCEEIIIESGNSIQALWGEILASMTGAKHIFYTMDEQYRTPGSHYAKMIDFFIFKFKRGEILGGSEVLRKLFEGSSLENFPFIDNVILDEAPIAEISNILVDSLCGKDWNICYLGRANKIYVDTVIKEVAKFARLHSSKSIQFIIIGDFSQKQGLLNKEIRPLANVTLTLLGEMVPIPKSLYDKIDVIIAGSGSARHSVYQGKPVIVPDCYSGNSMGIYGYQTLQSLYQEDTTSQVSISDSLEDALVKQIHLKMPFIAPPQKTPEICTIDNLNQIRKSDENKDYYPVLEKSKCARKWHNILKLYILEFAQNYFQKSFVFLMRIVKRIRQMKMFI